jgi:hypothetical protein
MIKNSSWTSSAVALVPLFGAISTGIMKDSLPVGAALSLVAMASSIIMEGARADKFKEVNAAVEIWQRRCVEKN